MVNKSECLDLIKKYQFYALDLNLYLDNFPENEEAKKDYNIICKKLISLIMQYESKYGSLINFGLSFDENNDYSAWTDSPWPWENNKE